MASEHVRPVLLCRRCVGHIGEFCTFQLLAQADGRVAVRIAILETRRFVPADRIHPAATSGHLGRSAVVQLGIRLTFIRPVM